MVEFMPGMIVEDRTVKYIVDNLSVVQEVDNDKKILYCYPIGMNAVIYQNKNYPKVKVLFKNAVEKKRIDTFYNLFDNVSSKQIVEGYKKIELGDIIFIKEENNAENALSKENADAENALNKGNAVVVAGKSDYNKHIIKILNSSGKSVWTSFAVQNFEQNMVKVCDGMWRMGAHV